MGIKYDDRVSRDFAFRRLGLDDFPSAQKLMDGEINNIFDVMKHCVPKMFHTYRHSEYFCSHFNENHPFSCVVYDEQLGVIINEIGSRTNRMFIPITILEYHGCVNVLNYFFMSYKLKEIKRVEVTYII